MAQLKYGVPSGDVVLAIFYDSNGDIVQIDPMEDGTLINADGTELRFQASAKETLLKDRTDLGAVRKQTLLRPDPATPSTKVSRVHLADGCLWVDHGGRNIWRCP